MRARDRALGIFLGVLLGVAIVIAFVFLGSQGTIDAPSVDGGGKQTTTVPKPGRETQPAPRP